MDILALVIAVVALVVSAAAFSRTGGMAMLQEQAEEARRLAANALGRVEEVVRPHQHDGDAPATPEGKKPTTSPGHESNPSPEFP